MSVPALQFLWQIEDDCEDEFKRLLASVTANIYRSCEKSSEAQTPWLEITFLVGRVQGHQKSYPCGVNQGIRYYDTWIESALVVTVCTQRQNNNPQHKQIIGRARSLLQLASLAQVWTQPIHAITDIREAGTQRSVDDENDIDTSIVTFTVCHNIDKDAWPLTLFPAAVSGLAFIPSSDLAFVPSSDLAFA